MTVSKQKLLKHLSQEVYCHLAASSVNGVGVFALRAIPKGVEPLRSLVQEDEIRFTKEEIKRYKKWQKKQAQLEAQKIQARLDKRHKRLQAIKDAIEPSKKIVAETQQLVVESPKVEKKPIDINKIDAQLARVKEQQAQLLQAVTARMEAERLQAVLVARQLAELDDEEALLMLM